MKETRTRLRPARRRVPMARTLALIGTPAWAAAGLVLFGAPGNSQVPAPADRGVPVVSALVRTGDPVGVQVYARTCAYCHDHGVGPVITHRGLDPAVVRLMVRHGGLAMPAFRPTEISDAELAAVSAMLEQSK
ncbi:mono/diheme cytochrome c family protein [Novosphingobium capsulatum]|uniref:Mono/diheme cytochrome c family protein n=1 Tax=Novosphingobium capsulatum TaxID=13688 RepID=A0ABU1MLX0_9SPHN|nr:cytochrome c [Novosphingobium capsulatum]MDR6511331.1 mono/diheme cytochrome c family protein [Novosphingobium capsulatum]